MNDLNALETYARIDPDDVAAQLAQSAAALARGYEVGASATPNADGLQHIIVRAVGGAADAAAMVGALINAHGISRCSYNVVGSTLPPSWIHSDNRLLLWLDEAPELEGVPVIATRSRVLLPGEFGSDPYYWVGHLIAIVEDLGLLPPQRDAMIEACALLQEGASAYGPASPTHRNSSKRVAGQFMDRMPVIYGSGLLAPVAQHWKTQLNTRARMFAAAESMPELVHSSVFGYAHATDVWRRAIVIALRCGHDLARDSALFDATRTALLEAGINQDTITARGKSRLAQMMNVTQYGDWVAYYTAVMKGTNPS